MIVKVDIEKAYDTLGWKDILSTLAKMNFLTIWLFWIQPCISSPSFSLFINGRRSNILKPQGMLDRVTFFPPTFSL